MLPSAVQRLLPTPTTQDGANTDEWAPRQKSAAGDPAPHGKSLAIEAQRILPTPVIDPVSGNGHARDLGGEVKRLPTPEASDGSGGRQSSEVGATRPSGSKRAVTLGTVASPAHTDRWGEYAAGVHRWETVTRPAPDPTEPGSKGQPRLSPRFTEWMMGLPDGWVTNVPGVTRNEALKMCGNGVVPQQAAAGCRHLFDRALLTLREVAA